MSSIALTGAALTAVGLVATLLAERMESSELRFIAKPSASVGFLIVAVGSGALDSAYGAWILAGLVLSLGGDVLLMFRDLARFRAGLVAFLLGHVAYLAAFAVLGVAATWVAAAAVATAIAAAAVLRWLGPHVDDRMRRPVLAYVVVISVMLVLAVGTRGADHTPLIMWGATLFYVSDLFVARERFMTPSFFNRLVGLPLYYCGQVLLALSVAA